MKRIMVLGKNAEIITKLLEQEGLTVVDSSPEAIITHGGDGLLLEAERQYPSIPKLPIRRNSICKTCVDHETTHVIKALARGSISTTSVNKLETAINGRTLLALNEFSLHNSKPTHAIRFSVRINSESHVEAAIGDGVIVATPFGSHAYYRSITKSTIRSGIGIAFNNTTEPIDHIVVSESDMIVIDILRGPAYFFADNDFRDQLFKQGENFTIKQSVKTATLLGLDQFLCPDCENILV